MYLSQTQISSADSRVVCASRGGGANTGLESELEDLGLNLGSAPYDCVTLNMHLLSVKGIMSGPHLLAFYQVVSEKMLCQGERVQTLVVNGCSSGHQECSQLQGAWPFRVWETSRSGDRGLVR